MNLGMGSIWMSKLSSLWFCYQFIISLHAMLSNFDFKALSNFFLGGGEGMVGRWKSKRLLQETSDMHHH